MIRRAKLAEMPEVIDGFRMRGTEVSRMEAFADCVFGFGLALLVVQLEVPKSFDGLWQTMRGFVAFAFCFAIFFGVWSRHYNYCRRIGLQDVTVRTLTAILLFVLLAYLYPLKFLTVVFVTWVLGIDIGWAPVKGDHIDVGQLFIIYGLGFVAMALLLPEQLIGLAGYAYIGMGFVGWWHGSMHHKGRKAIIAKLKLSEENLTQENEMVES